MSNTYTVFVEYDANLDEYVLPLPSKMCDELGWKTDDVLVWTMEDDKIILKKKE